MSETELNDKLFGYLALGLFVAGLLVPFLIALFASEDIAFGFGIVAEVLALVFGILGWRQKTGKVAVIGISALLVLAVFSYFLWFSIEKSSEEKMMIRTKEALERKAEQKNDSL